MKTSILVAALVLAGCQRDQGHTNTLEPQKTPSADNTKTNERDRILPTLTPADQAENALDRGITQMVRQGVIGDDNLSLTAKNVKIITIDGVVTLRGPVKSEEERRTVAVLAQRVPGVRHVENQLEIASN
ncbi:putative hyperosmotically inducible periplasmic protein [Minicystis rosea]|nr:putative hyperosmotically inducible periplasmic protein [Minicystis rosea]